MRNARAVGVSVTKLIVTRLCKHIHAKFCLQYSMQIHCCIGDFLH